MLLIDAPTKQLVVAWWRGVNIEVARVTVGRIARSADTKDKERFRRIGVIKSGEEEMVCCSYKFDSLKMYFILMDEQKIR